MSTSPLHHLDHIAVFVSNLSAAKEFYERALGLELVEEREYARAFIATMRSDSFEVRLSQPKQGEITPHLNHLSYRLSRHEHDRLVEDLRRRGIPFSGPHEFEGERFIKIKDPDGIIWECICAGT